MRNKYTMVRYEEHKFTPFIILLILFFLFLFNIPLTELFCFFKDSR